MTGAFLPKSDGSERKWKCVSKDLSGSVSQGKFRPQTLQRSKLFLLSEQLRCHQSSAHWVMVQQTAVITYNFPQCYVIFVVSPLCLNFWLFPSQTQAGWWRRVTYEKAVWLMFQISSMKMEERVKQMSPLTVWKSSHFTNEYEYKCFVKRTEHRS